MWGQLEKSHIMSFPQTSNAELAGFQRFSWHFTAGVNEFHRHLAKMRDNIVFIPIHHELFEVPRVVLEMGRVFVEVSGPGNGRQLFFCSSTWSPTQWP